MKEKVQLNSRMPERLKRRMDAYVGAVGATLQDFITDAIREKLDQCKAPQAPVRGAR